MTPGIRACDTVEWRAAEFIEAQLRETPPESVLQGVYDRATAIAKGNVRGVYAPMIGRYILTGDMVY